MVQEYERAVIFRLGRLLQGGSKGPGMDKELFCMKYQEKKIIYEILLCLHNFYMVININKSDFIIRKTHIWGCIYLIMFSARLH